MILFCQTKPCWFCKHISNLGRRWQVNSILIAVEGIDGSGKSTLVKYIEEELKKEGRQVARFTTREVEKEPIFQAVIDGYSLNPHSPAYMFFFQLLHAHKADRARRALEEGKIVVVAPDVVS